MTSSTPTPAPAYERPSAIVRRTGLSRTFIYDALASGRIPSLKAGRSVLVPVGAIERFLDEETERQRGRLLIDRQGGAAAG